MRALVTGVAGFIGSTLAERLLTDGADVVGLDCFTDYYPRPMKERNLVALVGHPRFALVESSIQKADLATLLADRTHVFHLAAQAGVRKSWGRDFGVYTVNNIEATQILLEACTEVSLERIVYASSSSVYGDGGQTRDFTFVADAVNATIAVATRGTPGRVYNIGGGSRVSINQVLEMIARVSGRRPLITVDPAQKGDMRHTYADTRLARTELGFEPAVGLEEGLAAEHKWLAGIL